MAPRENWPRALARPRANKLAQHGHALRIDSRAESAQTKGMRSFHLSLLCWLAGVSAAFGAEKTASVTVEAGDFDRTQTVVIFPLPPALKTCNALKLGDKIIPLQVDRLDQGAFVIEHLKKGSKVTFELVPPGAPPSSPKEKIFASRDGARLKIALARGEGGAAASPLPLLDYQVEPGTLPREEIKPIFQRGAYLHPIRTLTGKVVTDDFPSNHIHHHGVWWSWTSTEFDGRKPDFWNMGDGKGRVEPVSLDDYWSGAVHAGFRSRQRFIDLMAPEPVNALNESWEVIAYAPAGRGGYWLFDLVSRQRCATTNTLKLPEYRYGGLGVRGNWAWNGTTNVAFLTSAGETDRIKGNTQLGRWCDMSGRLDDAVAGITILCHPDNFRAPQPMRLHPSEPFFNFAPQQAGDMAIQPEETYVSRYRFVIHDGPADQAELDRLWNDYAHPPVVTVRVGTN